ncbi:hypothetical protein ACFPK5_28670 [Streptomyces beijiangensis]
MIPSAANSAPSAPMSSPLASVRHRFGVHFLRSLPRRQRPTIR